VTAAFQFSLSLSLFCGKRLSLVGLGFHALKVAFGCSLRFARSIHTRHLEGYKFVRPFGGNTEEAAARNFESNGNPHRSGSQEYCIATLSIRARF
jgi:hypothetical protein